jgi:type IV conjugative transfer system protein TraL
MKIKKTLNNIPRLVFWRIDDAFVFLMPFTLGVLFGSLLLMGLGVLSIWLYRSIRKRNQSMNFNALMYWLLGYGFNKIPSHMRRIRR